MSETVTVNNQVVRNSITKTLSDMVFGKKSDHAGAHFFAPEVATPELKTVVLQDGTSLQCLTNISDLLWVGLEDVTNIVANYLRRTFADILLDNTDEKTGVVNWAQMYLDWADFSGGVQKLSDVDDQLEELQAFQQSLAMDDAFGSENPDGTKTERALELEKLIKETAAKIKPLRIQKATIEAKYAERVAKRRAKKAAAEAAKKATPTAEAATA